VVLTSTVILGSDSHGTHGYILLSHDSGSHATSQYKQDQGMGHLNGVSMTTTLDDDSDNEFIPIPLPPQGVSKWEQPTGGTKSNNHQFTGDMTKKTECCAPYK
jgi:hypothetical protein